MPTFYRIQISSIPNQEVFERISSILKLNPKKDFGYHLWTFEITNDYFKSLEILNLLITNIKSIYQLGINKEDISFWALKEYENQCNLEFEPSLMKILGENEITFCISCWEK